jgi:hypothetical protein
MSYLQVPSSRDIVSSPSTIYVTLQLLRKVDGVNKYHWGLFMSDNRPPMGTLVHATDFGRDPLDLYMEVRAVSDPTRSKSMVVALQISSLSSVRTLIRCAESVPLMDRRRLPGGERMWTCRVWVKEVLNVLHKNNFIRLPMSTNSIERHCQYTADTYIKWIGQARVFNDLSWLNQSEPPPQPSQRYNGPSPMMIDSPSSQTDSRYRRAQQYDAGDRQYTPDAMETETYRTPRHRGANYGPKPMVTERAQASHHRGQYYGSKPMVTDTSRYY